MGVPAFYRWLSERYSRIVVYAKEEADPEDLTDPNPNGYEFDHLYLDMNGLIHPCTHPEDEEAPPTEEDMYIAIFSYLDRLFALIRPRKLLYMAIDGVAPRAKMNQQRSRRFRSSQEAEEAKKDAENLRQDIIKSGRIPPKMKSEPWDSNVITPGTPFMVRLAKRIKEYVAVRQNSVQAWKDIKVVFSDAQYPGEGEHKIMDFIRAQRLQEHYDPNTTHCLYGLDADLIMLGLATHEIHFTILREEVLFGRAKKKSGFSVDHVLLNKDGQRESNLAIEQYELLKKKKKPFQLLRLWVLREYLEREFAVEKFYNPLKFPYDFERCIDDFIFLCFFVGNDFLPHLPTLSIREGGLELILDLYKRFLPTLDGYVTDSGVINFARVEVILQALGAVEDEIFKRRRGFEKMQQRRRIQRQNYGHGSRGGPSGDQRASGNDEVAKLMSQYKSTESEKKRKLENGTAVAGDGKTANRDEKASDPSASASKIFSAQLKDISKKRSSFEVVDAGDFAAMKTTQAQGNRIVLDEVKLGESGWKARYYEKKFPESVGNVAFTEELVKEYVIGLSWVLMYYFQGCKSWKWYYPYHYAPFASDLVKLSVLQEPIYGDIKDGIPSMPLFPPSKPFSPYEQLLGVLPAKSSHALPACFRWYMTDEDSSIIDFYPVDFKYDPDGKGVRWLWVALLPFVDEERITKVMKEAESKLSEKEKKRNAPSENLCFIHAESKYGELIQKVLLGKGGQEPEVSSGAASDAESKSKRKKVAGVETEGLSGYVSMPQNDSMALGASLKSKSKGLVPVDSNSSLCFRFDLPEIESLAMVGKLLSGVSVPEKTLSENDLRMIDLRSNRRGHFVGNIYGELHDAQVASTRGAPTRGGDRGGSGSRHQQSYSSHRSYNENQYSGSSHNNHEITSSRNYGSGGRGDSYDSRQGNSWGSLEPRRQAKRSAPRSYSHGNADRRYEIQRDRTGPPRYQSRDRGASSRGSSNEYPARSSGAAQPRHSTGSEPRTAKRGDTNVFDHIESQLNKHKKRRY